MRKKIEIRSMTEADLPEGDRDGLYDRQARVDAAMKLREDVIAMARCDRQGFGGLARWVVATCRVGTEFAVSDSLAASRIECWCPRERFRKPPRRGLPAVDGYRPIFRGYLFVRVIPDAYAYAGLMAAAKLRGLMGQDGRPYRMPDALMDDLMLASKEKERKQQDIPSLPPLPKLLGKRVVIRSGPFSDFAVTVRRVLAERRQVVVDVPIFGAMREIPIGVDSIKL